MRMFRHKPHTALSLMFLAVSLLLVPFGQAHADDDEARIKVMTQNQYLGADLTPLVEAGGIPDPDAAAAAFNAALIGVLKTIGESNYPERVQSLAQTIVDSNSDLVGLQEMWAFGCIPISPTIPEPCSLPIFENTFNDHLQATLDALDNIGGNYYVAAQARNLDVPGLPVFLDESDLEADIIVTVVDRDVILAHDRIDTKPVSYTCWGKPSLDGCNYSIFASLSLGDLSIDINRSFVAVDAIVRGDAYRFVNTHLEVRFPDPSDVTTRIVQSLQADELISTLATQTAPQNTRLIVVGDINSDPNDFPLPNSGPLSPYQQFVSGLSFQGEPISTPYNDVWALKYKQRPGLTCCEEEDLRNRVSVNDRRVDVIFSLDKPDKVKAKTLNTKPKDKTPSGLWPSDHATVAAKLKFDDDDDD